MKKMKNLVYLCLLFAVFACGKKTESSQTLPDGKYCFTFKDEVNDNKIELTIAGNTVSGTYDGTIQDQKNSYFTSFGSDFTGTKDGENLTVEVTLEIEGSVQKTSEKWTLVGNTLKTDKMTYTKVENCTPTNAENANTENTNTATNFANAQFSWDIQIGKNQDQEPVSDAFLVLNGKKYAVAEKFIGEMMVATKEDYSRLQVPKEALLACSVFWAGGSSIFYVLPNNENEITLYKTYLGEEGGKAMVDKKTSIKPTDFK
jgi:hypothetical protein